MTAIGAALHAALEAAAPGEPMALARRLGIAGAAARLTGLADPRPEAERAWSRLLAVERFNTARSVSAAFRDAAVRHAFVKDAALAAWYRPGDRDADDLDLLVSHDQLDAAHAALARLGYAPEPGAERGAPHAMRRGWACVGPPPPAPVIDLQWGLTSVNRLLSDCDPAALDGLWDHVTVEEGIAVPPAWWHFALLFHHLVHHDLLHGRAVLDLMLVEAALAPGDIARARAVAARLRVRRVMDRWLAGRLVPARLLALADRSPAVDHERVTVARLVRRWRLLDARRDAWRLVRDAVVPPQAYLAWRWPDASGPVARWWRHASRTAAKLILPG